MSQSAAPTELKYQHITVTAKDLPLHCPMPSMKLWDTHPRVFINLSETGEAKCPYCGTVYALDGPAKAGH